MLEIDKIKMRTLRFYEALLKHNAPDKEKNLSDYKNTAVQIDKEAFDNIIDVTKCISDHNQSLEEELEFLEGIVNTYNQLLELQTEFKKSCKVYGSTDIELSDLSILNIEYIKNRLSAIKGYLTNIKDIDANKERLQELNGLLIEEEKKKIVLDKRLLDLENILRSNFVNTEGRVIINGKLVPINVSMECKKIGIEFANLLNDANELNATLAEFDKEKREIAEKLRVAEVCHNNSLTSETRFILNEINAEFLAMSYKVTILKIISLISQNSENYDLFIKKRKDIIELINSCVSIMEQLGMKVSVDPFASSKVKEQLELVLDMPNNANIINKIRKDITSVSSHIDSMVMQNDEYLITISDTKDLVINNISMNDVDISSVVSFDELISKRKVSDNQVVSVKNISDKFNSVSVSKKTVGVIKRVNHLMNGEKNNKVVDLQEEYVPELEIVPGIVNVTEVSTPVVKIDDKLSEQSLEEETSLFEAKPVLEFDEKLTSKVEFDDDDLEIEDDLDDEDDLEIERSVKGEQLVKAEPVVAASDIFATVTPFVEPTLFDDRTDDNDVFVKKYDNSLKVSAPVVETKTEEVSDIRVGEDEGLIIGDSVETMPEAFWVTQMEEPKKEKEDEDTSEVISFDEQINMLLADEKDSAKVRKRVA